ncbi:lycopene cyclase domain-containing protein [Actinomycetota bacterium]
MELINFAYLLALLASLTGVTLIDHRWRLFVFHAPRPALAVLTAGVAFFAAWDAVGIAAGLFFRGQTDFMTGWLIGPDFPVEEIFFLLLLCHSTMVAWRAAARRGGDRQ